MRTPPRLAILAATVALAGCTTLRRWSDVADLPASSPPEFSVTSAPAASPDAGLSVKDLPDRAGAAYIAALASRDKSASDLRGDIAKAITTPPSGIIDGSVVPRVLLVAVERPRIRPGDRLLMTRVMIRPADDRVSFTDYRLAATERSTIDIGTVATTDSLSGSANVGPGPAAGASLLPSASLAASRSQSVIRNINQEAIFSVSTKPDQIEIFRTGAEDRDLLGNTLIKVSVRLGSLNDAPIYFIADAHVTDDQTGAPLKPAKVSVNLTPSALFEPRDIYACATMAYEDREVTDPRSEDEGRQAVRIASGNIAPKPFVLIPYQDLQQPLWQIGTQGSYVAFSDALTMRTLSFDNYDAAEHFLGWLKKLRPSVIKNGRLVLNVGMAAPIPFDQLALKTVSKTIGARGVPPICPAE